jgi:hypothetical protein
VSHERGVERGLGRRRQDSERGVPDFPGVRGGQERLGLEQFLDCPTASLKLNSMAPATPEATKMRDLWPYLDGDLGDAAPYHDMWRISLEWNTARLIAAGT